MLPFGLYPALFVNGVVPKYGGGALCKKSWTLPKRKCLIFGSFKNISWFYHMEILEQAKAKKDEKIHRLSSLDDNFCHEY